MQVPISENPVTVLIDTRRVYSENRNQLRSHAKQIKLPDWLIM